MRIDANNVEDIIGLTFMQEAMLYDYIVNEGKDQYFEQIHIKLDGKVLLPLFRKAWQHVIDCNGALRTIFRWEGIKSPVQIILKKNEVEIAYYDLSETKDILKSERIEQIKSEEIAKGFNLKTVPFRVTLCCEESNLYHMIINVHHIIYDGWSNGILLKEFMQAYINLSQNISLPRVYKASYKEFVKLIKKQENVESFWRQYLDGIDTKQTVKRKLANDPKTCDVGAYSSKICRQITDKLNSIAVEKEITIASTFFAAWALCLQKYNYTDDIVFGTVVSGRNSLIKDVARIVGLFINTIPLRVKVQQNDTVIGLLTRVNKEIESRSDFEQAPISEIKKYVSCDKNEELFNSIMVIENYPVDKEFLFNNHILRVIGYQNNTLKTSFPITFEIRLFQEYEASIKYRKDIYEEYEVEKMMKDFIQVLADMAENPDCLVESFIYTGNISEEFTANIGFDFE